MSKKYVLPYKAEEERLKDLGRKKGKHEGRLEKAVERARVLKKKGVDVHVIAAASGLSLKQIEKL